MSAGNGQPPTEEDDWLTGASPNPYAEKPTARDEAEIERITAELEALSASDENDSLGNLTAPEASSENAEKHIAGQQLRGISESAISDTPYLVAPFPPHDLSPYTKHALSASNRSSQHTASTVQAPVPVDPLLAIIADARLLYPGSDTHTGIPARRRAYVRLAHHDRLLLDFEALQELGAVHAITINLSPAIESKARREALQGRSPLNWLHRRVKHELDAVGLPCAFVLVPEEAPVKSKKHAEREAFGLPGATRLHLHGIAQFSAKEKELANEALSKAGGKVEDHFRRYQIDAQLNPDAGWVRYIVKDFEKRFLAAVRLGAPFSVTRNVRALAEKRYDQERIFYRDLRRCKY